MNQDDVEWLAQETVYRGFGEVKQLKLRHRLHSGAWGPVLTRELFCQKPAVGVLLIDSKRRQVVLLHQFRVAVLESEPSPWLYEIVAGVCDGQEAPEATAKREVREEAGIEIHEVFPIYDYWVSPGATNEFVRLYYAEIDSHNVGGIHGCDEEGEDILVQVFSDKEIAQLLASGKIRNSLTLLALQWLSLKWQ